MNELYQLGKDIAELQARLHRLEQLGDSSGQQGDISLLGDSELNGLRLSKNGNLLLPAESKSLSSFAETAAGTWSYYATDPAIGHDPGRGLAMDSNPAWWYFDGSHGDDWTCRGPFVTLEPGNYVATWHFKVLVNPETWSGIRRGTYRFHPVFPALNEAELVMQLNIGFNTPQFVTGLRYKMDTLAPLLNAVGEWDGSMSLSFNVPPSKYQWCDFRFANDGPLRWTRPASGGRRSFQSSWFGCIVKQLDIVKAS